MSGSCISVVEQLRAIAAAILAAPSWRHCAQLCCTAAPGGALPPRDWLLWALILVRSVTEACADLCSIARTREVQWGLPRKGLRERKTLGANSCSPLKAPCQPHLPCDREPLTAFRGESSLLLDSLPQRSRQSPSHTVVWPVRFQLCLPLWITSSPKPAGCFSLRPFGWHRAWRETGLCTVTNERGISLRGRALKSPLHSVATSYAPWQVTHSSRASVSSSSSI